MADPIIDRIDAVLAEDDDIDLMVDAALAVGEPEWAGDWDRYPEVCPHRVHLRRRAGVGRHLAGVLTTPSNVVLLLT